MSSTRKPTPNQLSQNLPGPTAYLTGHDDKSGKAVIHSSRPVVWHQYDEEKLGMSVAYTTQFPPDLNNDADVTAHDKKMEESGGKLGLVSGGYNVRNSTLDGLGHRIIHGTAVWSTSGHAKP